MKVVCAWCERSMGENEHEPRELVTHSICGDCAKDFFSATKIEEDAMPVKQAPTKFEFDLMVVGMGFRLKRDVRQVLAQTAERRGVAVKLVREQENKYDLNAVKVIHADTGALAGKHLGYLSAETAAILAPLLDNGKNGGLKFKSAKLIDMDGELDHKQGTVHAVFDDFRK